MWNKIWNPSNRKVFCLNLITAVLLNLFLEYMERKSCELVWQFMKERTFVFLYNALIIFVALSIVFIVRKKLFAYTIITVAWFAVGLINGIVLNDRKTPFTAVDLTLAKSILPILKSYLAMWQITGAVILLVAGVVALVCLYLYSPEAKKSFDVKTNAVMVTLLVIFFAVSSYLGINKGQLIQKFDNLIAGYQDYGVAYGFCVTALDTGIDRPIDYSRKKVESLVKKIDKKTTKKNNPNIIFIQLESFFDISTVKGLTVSEDPIPNVRQIRQECTSGYLKVPVYGAGTINTEFEVLTGMSTGFFGTGEYPYRSVLHKKCCDSIAYWLKDSNYESSVIHNNNASFYDRNKVFSNLGIQNFVTIENMDVKSRNEAGWSKDSILTNNIINTMNTTSKKDMIYAISVQGHGDYPSDDQSASPIQVTGEGYSQSYLNQATYYANQTKEMDDFIGELLGKLSDYPEDTMVIAYGDHLPGLEIESSDLKNGSKYETPYFIWDNFGYNKENKEKESGDIYAYQLASKVLEEMGISDGILNRYHQNMKKSSHYKTNLKLLQYDMLYGADFVREGEDPLEPTTINYSLQPLKITKVKREENSLLLLGEGFTDASRVFVNGIRVKSQKMSDTVIKISKASLKDGDQITVHQVSETNENITLNESEVYEFHMENETPLYENTDFKQNLK